MVDSNFKREKILNIIQNEKPYDKVRLAELDKDKIYEVHQIPLALLTLNPKNSRFESEHKKIYNKISEESSPYEEKEQKSIQEIILNQNKTANNRTEIDLIKKGQIEPAVITNDGLLISGNRRFSIIKKINVEYTLDKHIKTMKAIVLPDVSFNDYKKIKKLEYLTQFGKDPVQKYSRLDTMLAMRNYQKLSKKTDEEIVDHFNWKEPGGLKQIKEILEIVDEYLEGTKMKENYEYVKEKEGGFKNLKDAIKKIKDNSAKIDWVPSPADISHFKQTMFKLLRFQPEGKKFHDIIKVGSDAHIFYDKPKWLEFCDKVKHEYDDAEKCRQNFKNQKPPLNFKEIEEKVIKKKKEKFNGILTEAVYEIQNLKNLQKPDKLINALKKSIDNIGNYCNEKKHIKKEIKKDVRDLSQELDELVKKLFDNSDKEQ